MNLLLLVFGKPLLGMVAGATVYSYRVSSVRHEFEFEALQAEIEAIDGPDARIPDPAIEPKELRAEIEAAEIEAADIEALEAEVKRAVPEVRDTPAPEAELVPIDPEIDE